MGPRPENPLSNCDTTKKLRRAGRVTPAMAAGVDNVVRGMDWIVGMIDAAAPLRPVRLATSSRSGRPTFSIRGQSGDGRCSETPVIWACYN